MRSRYRNRLLYGSAGALLPIALIGILEILDERGVLWDIPFYIFFVLYGVVTIPGWLLPVGGGVTLALVTAWWGVVGFLVGLAVDRERGVMERNERDVPGSLDGMS